MFSESPCEGETWRYVVQEHGAADTLHNLHRLYCGCKFITRSLSINLLDNNKQIFREEEFNNIFYYLQEINNVFYIKNVNMNGGRIIFPNLRIIRGNSNININGNIKLAMRVINVNASKLILPRLTEISNGGVHIHGTFWQLTNVRRVLWSDIIDETMFEVSIDYHNVKQGGKYYCILLTSRQNKQHCQI